MDSNEGTAVNSEAADDRLGPVRSTRLRPEDDDTIQQIAARDDRPFGYVLRKLVEKALAAAA